MPISFYSVQLQYHHEHGVTIGTLFLHGGLYFFFSFYYNNIIVMKKKTTKKQKKKKKKKDFSYAKTKAQISCAVAAQLISAFAFPTRIAQFLFFLNPKFQASSHLL